MTIKVKIFEASRIQRSSSLSSFFTTSLYLLLSSHLHIYLPLSVFFVFAKVIFSQAWKLRLTKDVTWRIVLPHPVKSRQLRRSERFGEICFAPLNGPKGTRRHLVVVSKCVHMCVYSCFVWVHGEGWAADYKISVKMGVKVFYDKQNLYHFKVVWPDYLKIHGICKALPSGNSVIS